VVLLGAGASIAAYEHWGRVGSRLPAMADLIDVLSLRAEIENAGFEADRLNFEAFYDSLVAKSEYDDLRTTIELRVYEYFGNLVLPNTPTIYDHLILSLRQKDLIASFNWDPFLLQAYMRNEVVTRTHRPRIAFLHGNVLVGVCPKCRVAGVQGRCCGRCGEFLHSSKLLYPVRQKDYEADPFIKSEWACLRGYLDWAYMLTIFGYGAPKTDIAARSLMLDVWKKNETLELAEVEVVDIKSRTEIEKTWTEFFYSHHYGTTADVFNSYLFMYPRQAATHFLLEL
jgi:hypothetical protein